MPSLTKPRINSFSIRTKILVAYGALVLLFFLILLTGFSQFKGIASRLNMIQLVYYPLSNRLSSFSSLYHMDSDFNYNEILKNYQNPMFVNAVTNLNPKILDQGLRRSVEEAQKAVSSKSLVRLQQIADELLRHHGEYTALIQTVIDHLRNGRIQEAERLQDQLLEKKRNVKSHLDFFSSRVSDLIRKVIQEIVQNERRAVFAIAALSAITFLLAIVIGLVSISTLTPLRTLKETAQEIAAGNLSIRAPLLSRDEVGDLAREFNTMADSIQERDTAIRTQQEQLIESQKMGVIGQMASKISHEIRNPLNALSLNVELLDEQISGAEPKKLVKSISTEIDRLNRITQQYLDIARAPVEEIKKDVDLHEILVHLEALLRPECAKLNMRFQSEIGANLPILRLNPTGLEQALLNLSRNAMEAVGNDGAWGLKTYADENHVTIDVWDRGPGIPDTQLAAIFEPFFTTKPKGTGLGLAITKEIVKNLGGMLTCATRLNEGTTFTIRLPIA